MNTNLRYHKLGRCSLHVAGDVEQFQEARCFDDVVVEASPVPTTNNDDLYPNVDWTGYVGGFVDDTFKYIFHHMKKGIFVKVSDNRLVNFLPFCNLNYVNNFADRLRVDDRFVDAQEFIDFTQRLLGYQPVKSRAKHVDEWVANNALMRYENAATESDNNVIILHDMFDELCRTRNVPDIEFFLNRRDFPLLSKTNSEPYFHIFDRYDEPLPPSYAAISTHAAPVLSMSSDPSIYADIMIPTYEDWTRAKFQRDGIVFPNDYRTYPPILSTTEFVDRQSAAVFRGSTTGAGVTSSTNQRLAALELAQTSSTLLDVGITKWNARPRKYMGERFLRTIERPTYPIANRMSLQEQADKYRYILNLEGHVAAYRLSYELSCGSVVLLATSRWKVWYSHLILPYVHYVPVACDLHDLVDRVRWCNDHPDECVVIAGNAQRFYAEHLNADSILDHLGTIVRQTARTVGTYRQLRRGPSIEEMVEELSTTMSTSNRLNRCRAIVTANAIKTIAVYDTDAGRTVVRKNANVALSSKWKEYVNENYIGTRTINEMIKAYPLQLSPHFVHVYDPSPTDDGIYAAGIVVVENVDDAVTFSDWIKTSTDFTLQSFVCILLQLNCVFRLAYEKYNFVHYDVYPWNVMIKTLKTEQTFEYDECTVRTNKLPVLIDYGKSRVRGGWMYNHSSAIDSIVSIVSSVNECIKYRRLSSRTLQFFYRYLDAALPYMTETARRDVRRLAKYGVVWPYVDDERTKCSPTDFIKYIGDNYMSDRIKKLN